MAESSRKPAPAAPRPSDRREEQVRQRARLEALLDRLDARDAADDAKRDRRAMRCAYRRFGVDVLVHHPGGTSTPRKVLTRDLSAGGLSFIHNGYLHKSTRVEVGLKRYIGGVDTCHGQVVYCDHISGSWHTVGAKFDRKVFPKLYLDPAAADTLDASGGQPHLIEGRVLIVDPNELDRRLVSHHLRRTKVELVGVATVEEARVAVAKADRPFDLVVVDPRAGVDQAGGDPVATVRAVLEMADAVPVAICTAEPESAAARAAADAGVRGVLAKPYEAERLMAAISNWLGASSAGGEDPIHSPLADQPDARPILGEFVENAGKLARGLKEAAGRGDAGRCRAICQTLRGSGSGYGFPSVTDAATEALRMLDDAGGVPEAAACLQRLQDVCARLTADPPAPPASPPASAAA